jgi:hypothetical protein
VVLFAPRVNFVPRENATHPGVNIITRCYFDEWRGELRIYPLEDNFTPKGQRSPLGANFTPGGHSSSLWARLKTGLCAEQFASVSIQIGGQRSKTSWKYKLNKLQRPSLLVDSTSC